MGTNYIYFRRWTASHLGKKSRLKLEFAQRFGDFFGIGRLLPAVLDGRHRGFGLLHHHILVQRLQAGIQFLLLVLHGLLDLEFQGF